MGVFGIEEAAAAGGDDDGFLFGGFGDGLLFVGAEGFFALLFEDLGDVSVFFDDFGVDVDAFSVQFFGEGLGDGGFSGAGHADDDDVFGHWLSPMI